MKCILIIDPQKDFTGREGNYAKRHAGITQILDARERINRILSLEGMGDRVIVVSDYHADQFEQGLAICVPGTEGHEIDVDADGGISCFSKNQHSCFSSPEFTEYLRVREVKELVICGFLAEYCVQQTALDALERGYEVVLVKDCIGTGDDVQERKKKMLAALHEKGARVVETWPVVHFSKSFGREAFGGDPAGYHAARPPYPEWVFEVLRDRCGLRPGTATFEIGAGTGIATRRLLDLGASPLVAVEPDERLAKFLREGVPDGELEVVNTTFEEVVLEDGGFDLGVCATAFHWLDEDEALEKVARLLRPGGWWAMIWNVFGDNRRADAFHEATKTLLEGPMSPSAGTDVRSHFALETGARKEALRRTGAFDIIEYRSEPWVLTLDADETIALYATYSNVNIRPDREAVLAELGRIARTEFNNAVTRNIVTSLYIARRIFTVS